ncbi:MAG: transcription-repair coupling factor [Chloroflexota bacterium]|nr:transcription-repair coupling factor [Chloroflexota bacterium]
MSLAGLLPLFDDEFAGWTEGAGVSAGDDANAYAAWRGVRPLYLASLWRKAQAPVLVLTPRPDDSRRLFDQLLTYLGESAPVHLLPEPEVLPFERLAVDARTVNQRLVSLSALTSWRNSDSGAPIVLASVAAALRYTLSPAAFEGPEGTADSQATVRLGQRVPSTERLLNTWVNLGYRHEPVVEHPGSFSLRGGIIDVFPPQAEYPFRLELWDDEVDTIRLFDPYSQRSIPPAENAGPIQSVNVIPAREQLPELADRAAIEERVAGMDFSRCSAYTRERFEEELVELFATPNIETLSFYNGLLNRYNLLDYLQPECVLVLDRQSQIETEANDLEEKFFRMRESRESRGDLPRNFPSPYLSWDQLAGRLREHPRKARLESWLAEVTDPTFRLPKSYFGQLGQFIDDLQDQRSAGRAVVAVSQHTMRLSEVLAEVGIPSTVTDSLASPPLSGQVSLVPGYLSEGWETGGNQSHPPVSLYTDAELFGTSKERRYRPQRQREQLGDEIVLSDLIPGSYVVHVDHGVARFAGTTQMDDNGEEKEFLVLEYAENDRLYVPTDHLDRVGAYIGAQDQPPTLTRLGTAEWARIKERVKGSAREMAEELLKLYASRKAAEGHEFSQDSVWQRELEDSFPYVETPDQIQAIEEVKADMEQTKPMDRLICGDVGYGKTEVALRAAFKTVSDGMQVGLLVPTTVLAQQHYATFSERLSPYPLQVEVLSRFRTPREQQEVLEGLEHGTVDIVIGTHRLLQKDVKFKNLGLVVVDEEQRFGVGHKETLKRLRNQMDVLTLSATPIPRTLHMALTGIRDMSVMNTPPEARLPVKTFVSEYNEETIREAILREIERGGQVFFLHNRVRTIQQTAVDLAQLVPEARFMIGHGQMPETELEEVMEAFADGEADVLVCTTIIESGLDMPNVNTLILDRSDRFGLSQLYQLRGRVGRGEHRAYAYLLLPRGQRITEAAEQRVQVILEASELGSGFRIAMRDLEIRGAGNLLGAAQSGQIHAVGLELYGQLLEEAVSELMSGADGESVEESPAGPVELPRIELPMAASIPESYIPHTPTRLALYQRLARARDRQEVPGFREEMRDRFGPVPPAVENLLGLVELRILAMAAGVESVLQSSGGITLGLTQDVGSARVPLQRALGSSASVGNRQIRLSNRILGDQWLRRLTQTLERLMVFRDRLSALVPQ